MIKGMAGCGFMALGVGAQGYSAAVSGGGIIYQQLDVSAGYLNNMNGTNNRFAFSFVASGSGTPTSLTVYIQAIAGSQASLASYKVPCNVFIKNGNTIGSTDFGKNYSVSGPWYELMAGTNVIPLTNGANMVAGTTYYVVFQMRTNLDAYPQMKYKYTGATGQAFYGNPDANPWNNLLNPCDLAMILQ